MKRFLIYPVLLLIGFFCDPAFAESEVKAFYGQTYICGDSFEVMIQGEPILTTIITRHSEWDRPTLLQAGKYDMLFSIRLKLRNLTDRYYGGLAPDSFKLVGYVRGRPVEYLPEIMAPFNYGIKGAYILYDKMYYQTYALAPLRMIDMQLVYRVNPNLLDWELHVEPHENDWSFVTVEKPRSDIEPCIGVFRLMTVWDERTGQMIKYNP